MAYATALKEYIENWAPVWFPRRWAIVAHATADLRLELIGALVALGDEFAISDDHESYVRARWHVQRLKDDCDYIDAAKQAL